MTGFEDQVRRIRAEGDFFEACSPVFIGRSPGRLDLMGGNDDYTGGLVFEATIREATWAAVQLRNDRKFCFFNPQMEARGWNARPEFCLEDLTTDEAVRALVNRDQKAKWTAYAVGVFHLLKKRFP